MGLDKNIVNINANYINYIQSNPKLVLSVEDLALADTGTTGHYLTLNSPCINKLKAIYPLPIQMPNGEGELMDSFSFVAAWRVKG